MKFAMCDSYSGGRAAAKFRVRVMAVAEGYAMVRRPRAMPFVVSIKSLSEVDKRPATAISQPEEHGQINGAKP